MRALPETGQSGAPSSRKRRERGGEIFQAVPFWNRLKTMPRPSPKFELAKLPKATGRRGQFAGKVFTGGSKSEPPVKNPREREN